MKKFFTYYLAVIITIFLFIGPASAYPYIYYPVCHFQIEGSSLEIDAIVDGHTKSIGCFSIFYYEIMVKQELKGWYDVTVQGVGTEWPYDGMAIYHISAENLDTVAKAMPVIKRTDKK